MAHSVLDLMGIAGAGGSLEISASGKTALDLMGVAGAGRKHGAKLVLRDCGHLTALDKMGVAGASPGNVTFVG